jgi:hypothetical protein
MLDCDGIRVTTEVDNLQGDEESAGVGFTRSIEVWKVDGDAFQRKRTTCIGSAATQTNAPNGTWSMEGERTPRRSRKAK